MTTVRFRALTANSKQIKTPQIIDAFAVAQRKWVEETKAKLSKTPPPIPESRYKRTGDLVAGWKINGPRLTGDLITSLTNVDVDYVRYVHGTESGAGQVKVHRGRWVLLKDAIDRESYARLMRNVVKTHVQT